MDFCLRCNAWHDGLGCPINAEIARLRAELDAVTKQRDASRLVSEGLHASNVKLRAELDAAIKALGCGMGHGLESGASLAERIETREAAHREYLDAAKADLVSARAALDKEREVCDEARRLVGVPNPFDPKWNEDMRAWCDRYSARRAAEAKASACPLVGCGCDDPKQHETGSAAEAKEPPR